jgi:hypothetical protein
MTIFGKPSVQFSVFVLGIVVLFFCATESFEDEPTDILATHMLQNYNGQHGSNLGLIYKTQP